MAREAIIESRFEYKGYFCVVILQNMGFRCGYVGIKKGKFPYRVGYNLLDIRCHGGLTYSEDQLFGQDDEDTWWIGFDCAHYGDGRDFAAMEQYFNDDPESKAYLKIVRQYAFSHEVVRTKEYVESECRSIVDQLLAVETKKCGDCRWHEDFSGACCNGNSEYRGDFTSEDDSCECWEGKDNGEIH